LKPLIALFALLLLALAAWALPMPVPDGPFSTVLKYDGAYKAHPTNPVEFSSFTQVVETRLGGETVTHKSPGATTYSKLLVTVPTTGFYNDSNLLAWYNEAPDAHYHMKDIILEIRLGNGHTHAAYMFYRVTPASRRTALRDGITYATYDLNYTTFERDLAVIG